MRIVRILAGGLVVALFAPAAVEAQRVFSTDTIEWGLPLQPARWARFTATEGTWMSLDVSPDGNTIVFDLLGDLYTLPITGGTATRITDGIAHDVAPRFSPELRPCCATRPPPG